MPTLYIFLSLQTGKQPQNEDWRMFLQVFEECLLQKGIQFTYNLPKENEKVLALGLLLGGAAQQWCGGIVRYAEEYSQSRRLAGQIAEYLQEICPKSIESAPVCRKYGNFYVPTIAIELCPKGQWFFANAQSVAGAMAQAICGYFTQPEEEVPAQTATVETDGETQFLLAKPEVTSKVLCQLLDGEILFVEDKNQEYLHVRRGNLEGYVPKKCVTLRYPG